MTYELRCPQCEGRHFSGSLPGGLYCANCGPLPKTAEPELSVERVDQLGVTLGGTKVGCGTHFAKLSSQDRDDIAAILRDYRRMRIVYGEVFLELDRAIAKFPTWPTDPLHALAATWPTDPLHALASILQLWESAMSRCPHCQNTQGFVCGTCIECGWNHVDKRFHWIKVWIEDLHPSHDEDWMVQKHADSTRRAEKET